MAGNEHIAALRTARETLDTERRRLSLTMNISTPNVASTYVGSFIALQNAIDAIDAAIDDEEGLDLMMVDEDLDVGES
jgi:hypothetical protein